MLVLLYFNSVPRYITFRARLLVMTFAFHTNPANRSTFDVFLLK